MDIRRSVPGGWARPPPSHPHEAHHPPVKLYDGGEPETRRCVDVQPGNVGFPHISKGDLFAMANVLPRRSTWTRCPDDRLRKRDPGPIAFVEMNDPLPNGQMRSLHRGDPRTASNYAKISMDNDAKSWMRRSRWRLELTVDGDSLHFEFHRKRPGCASARLNLARSTNPVDLLHFASKSTFFREVP